MNQENASRAAGEASRSSTSGVEMKLLPPKKVVVAAGTDNRGRVLYYKLHPYSQITLEGERQFGFLLLVPIGGGAGGEWRGAGPRLGREVAVRER